jgi:hypothetical protein
VVPSEIVVIITKIVVSVVIVAWLRKTPIPQAETVSAMHATVRAISIARRIRTWMGVMPRYSSWILEEAISNTRALQGIPATVISHVMVT